VHAAGLTGGGGKQANVETGGRERLRLRKPSEIGMEGAAGFEKDSRRRCARDYRVEDRGHPATHLTAAALLHVVTAVRIILPATIKQRASSIAWRGKRAGDGGRLGEKCGCGCGGGCWR